MSRPRAKTADSRCKDWNVSHLPDGNFNRNEPSTFSSVKASELPTSDSAGALHHPYGVGAGGHSGRRQPARIPGARQRGLDASATAQERGDMRATVRFHRRLSRRRDANASVAIVDGQVQGKSTTSPPDEFISRLRTARAYQRRGLVLAARRVGDARRHRGEFGLVGRLAEECGLSPRHFALSAARARTATAPVDAGAAGRDGARDRPLAGRCRACVRLLQPKPFHVTARAGAAGSWNRLTSERCANRCASASCETRRGGRNARHTDDPWRERTARLLISSIATPDNGHSEFGQKRKCLRASFRNGTQDLHEAPASRREVSVFAVCDRHGSKPNEILDWKDFSQKLADGRLRYCALP